MDGAERPWDVVILAAGYGTRLRRDIDDDASGVFSAFRDVPKPLLPLGGASVVEHWLRALVRCRHARTPGDGAPPGVATVRAVRVVTNALHRESFEAALRAWRPWCEVVSDGSRRADERLGALADLRLACEHLPRGGDAAGTRLLVVAGDCLLRQCAVRSLLERFERLGGAHGAQVAVVGYALPPGDDFRRRGMLKVSGGGGGSGDDAVEWVEEVREKPATAEEVPAGRVASAPVYALLQRTHADRTALLERFLARFPRLADRDAPGQLVRWLCASGEKVALVRVRARLDIGSLQAYRDALALLDRWLARGGADKGGRRRGAGGGGGEPTPPWPSLGHERSSGTERPSTTSEEVVLCRVAPRIGILGNPSDGHGGAVLAASLCADVAATDGADDGTAALGHCGVAEVCAVRQPASAGVCFVPPDGVAHAVRFPGGLPQLCESAASGGFHPSVQLLQAAALTAHRRLRAAGATDAPLGFVVAFRSSIARTAGLGGSTALVSAALRCVCRLHGAGDDARALAPTPRAWAALVNYVERSQLRIAGGPMDALAQAHGGVVYIRTARRGDDHRAGDDDDADAQVESVEALSARLLPPLYVAHAAAGGGVRRPSELAGDGCRVEGAQGVPAAPSSGEVHAALRDRPRGREKEAEEVYRGAVEELASLARVAAAQLSAPAPGVPSAASWRASRAQWASLFRRNLAARRRLFSVVRGGDASLDACSEALLAIAESHGMAAKLTGSGGAVLCTFDADRCEASQPPPRSVEQWEHRERAVVAAAAGAFQRSGCTMWRVRVSESAQDTTHASEDLPWMEDSQPVTPPPSNGAPP